MVDIKRPDPPRCRCNERAMPPGKVRALVDGYERVITFGAGHACPLKGGNSHGRHGMHVLWLLGSARGWVHLEVNTDWAPDWTPYQDQPTHVQPWDLGYHSPTPRYEEQRSIDDCPWLGGVCYSDGSPSNAVEPFRVLVRDGEEALWAYLADYHRTLFGA